MSIAGKTLNDVNRGTVELPDGRSFDVDAITLSAEEAALLGEYQSWLSRERLSRKLFCRACGPSQQLLISMSPDRLCVLCHHRMLVFVGPVPFVETIHPSREPSAITPIRILIPDAPIAPADAYMLRRYDKFCQAYGLRESLWCDACDEDGNDSGIRPDSGPTHYALLCRCKRRLHTGLAV